MTGGSSGAAKPAITQRELEDFLALKAWLETLKECVARESTRLRQLAEGHAPVEPGRLQVEVRESTHQRISKAFLVSILGQADYEAMRGEAPPSVYHRLVVWQRPRESTSTQEQGAKNHGWTVFVKKERP